MIVGECPNCDAHTINPIADRCPAFERIICSECNKPYWLRHSRLDPQAYDEESFHSRYEVDAATKEIKEKSPSKNIPMKV